MTNDGTTFEEAKKCPKCGQPGEDMGSRKVQSPNSGKMVEIHSIYCRTQLCTWFDTMWIVQVNEDGTVPQAYSQLGRKQYPKLSPEMESKVNDSIRAQLAAETKPGGSEIINPYG